MTQPTVLSFLTAAKRVAFAFLLPTLAFAQYSSPVRDVENPAHSPLQLVYTITVPNGATKFSNANAAQVPFGKRMVVEHISVTCGTSAAFGVGVATLDFYAGSSILNRLIAYKLAVTTAPTNGDGVNLYYVSQALRLYADGDRFANMGGIVTLTAPAPGQFNCDFLVSGYTVNMP